MSEAALIICWVVSVVGACVGGFKLGAWGAGKALADAVLYRHKRTSTEGAKALEQLLDDLGNKGKK